MNLLSKLLGRDPSGLKILATLGPGEFSIVRSEKSPKGHRELIFKDASLSLLSTTRKYFVNLQVRDLSKDENADSFDELELEYEDDTTYLLHEGLRLGYFLREEQVVVTWKDLDGEEGTRFEFLCNVSVSKDSLAQFDEAAVTAQHGQKYGRDPQPDSDEFAFDYSQLEGASDDDIELVSVEPSQTIEPSEAKSEEDGPRSAKQESATTDAVSADAVSADLVKDEPVKAESEADPPVSPRREIVPSEAQPFSEGRIIIEAQCDLCVYDNSKGVFLSPERLKKATVVILDQARYEYFMEVRKDGKAVMGTPVQESLSQYVDLATKSLIFNYVDEDQGIVMSYLLRFSAAEKLTAVENQLSIAQWEKKNKSRFGDVDEDKQAYLLDALAVTSTEDQDMADQGDVEEDDFDEADAEYDEEEGRPPAAGSDERNTALEVGHVNDRTYVLRGNKIGVFKNTDRTLNFSTTIENFDIEPSRIMLHEQDRALVIQDKHDPKTLYRMDLETGKIVDEWKTAHEIQDFNPISKLAPTTTETNLFGVSDRSMFRIDPRLENGKVDRGGRTKKYKTAVNFSNVVTTGAGFIVVGNQAGEIRLFNQLGSAAQSLLPGMGDPIRGLDVTADGRYVLATCDRYLMLINTVTEKNNGFTSKWLKNERAVPRRLRLSPETIAHMRQIVGGEIGFTPARFNSGIDAKEATIVTSIGPYLITWDLARVEKGDIQNYRIKKYSSNITAENFKFGTDQRVILTLDNDVNMVAKSSLGSAKNVLK